MIRKYMRFFSAEILLLLSLFTTACGDNVHNADNTRQSVSSNDRYQYSSDAEIDSQREVSNMELKIGEKRYYVTLEDNDTAKAFEKLLPVTLDMSELNGNEKYNYLDCSLPSHPQNVGSIKAGDIMLYGDNCVVVFYKSFSTNYRYTPIGHINDTSDLDKIVGGGGIKAQFTMTE